MTRKRRMTYAQGRIFNDADSHIMELPDFLKDYADPAMRERMPAIAVPRTGALANLIDEAKIAGGHGAGRVSELVSLGDTLIAGPKGYAALGAFNAGERAKALDMLGFQRQLVFASFSELLAFDTERAVDDRYAVSRAHNRAMADFCSRDKRLCGVGLLPL